MAHMSAESSKEKSNIDVVTKALVALYEESGSRPTDACGFIIKKLGGRTQDEYIALESECERLNSEIAALKARLEARG